ncbi:MAG: DUF4124 domain-containing protein [Thiopseudomonas sp.]|jgi:hypothetical protein|nr:DUF4124 domain-containing protein [Thiopseudomonas sp.]HAB91425.1 DUF4124 domain-containing protein [Pseudomonas sp.]MBP7997146.1 DUF4124 domain-containing protein [Thiopseudomonas sp.]MBP8007935.1 DUF4124 domain-containing protein [Thiopseudomonas sp.]MBP8770557.1 DUF4124 domain-containing protein [Thiopseudomonas sp.]
MRRVITTASLLLLFSSSLLAAPVYKWVDDRGVTHFSAEPPVNQKAESIKTNSFQPKVPEKTAAQIAAEEAQASARTQAEVDREVRQKVAEEEAALKKYCSEIRHNLAQLESNPRVMAQVDGQPTRLTEEERQARITEIKKSIEERCATVK